MSKKTGPLRVLLADDHATVRHGLKLLIDAEADMTVVAEAGDGNEAVKKVEDETRQKMSGIMGGLGLPPGMF